MRKEWKIYSKELVKSFKALLLAVGISLLFYAANFQSLEDGQHLRFILISILYGVMVYAWVWILYAAFFGIKSQILVHNGQPAENVVVVSWPAHLTLGLVGTVFGLITAKWTTAQILHQEFSLTGMSETLLIGAFISLMFQFFYAYRDANAENQKLKATKAEAELHVFKNQMQPHFLFNSLNSLAEMIDAKSTNASIMTQRLSDLYRQIVVNSKSQVSSVDSEIDIIRNYLELEKLRFGGRLVYELKIDEQSRAALIPSLVLQALVENAIKHGISQSINGGRVSVAIYKNGVGHFAEVINSTSEGATKTATGTGIKNTRSRLDLLYGARHGFNLTIGDVESKVSFWFSGESVGG